MVRYYKSYYLKLTNECATTKKQLKNIRQLKFANHIHCYIY